MFENIRKKQLIYFTQLKILQVEVYNMSLTCVYLSGRNCGDDK